ncbi:MAG: metal-dependent hydrolase [Marinilabiliales bacterium]|nr:MAG: metal-dependent hydrolase [Marinilabiliales bacterium]
MVDTVQFGSKKIDFRICFSDRKTLGITITPEMEVVVKAPVKTSNEKIKEKVLKKALWIIRQQNFFLAFYPKTPEKKFVSGETHLYMGRQYRLKVTVGKSDEVKYKGRFIELSCKKNSDRKEILKKWYKERAKMKFSEIAEPLIERFKKYNVEPQSLYIQEMSNRWGSCTPKGKIILNTELIKAPRPCIEYVIIHELCHLVHHNHTGKFIELQTKEMPDWEKWKEKLENLLA